MSFLKLLGQIAVQGLQIATGVAPYAAPVKTVAQPLDFVSELKAIAGSVIQIEVASAAAAAAGIPIAGPQKLVMAAPLVKQIILASDLLTKHKIADPGKFSTGVDKVTSGVADILSSLNDHVDTVDKS